jgi:hypothetical protein
MPYDERIRLFLAEWGVSDVQISAGPELATVQSPTAIGQASAWSPCYLCLEGGAMQSYSSLVVVRLLMHEIWMWENEMADDDQARAESAAGSQSWNDPPERVPIESELLPCHYFDFFYGSSHGGVVATLLGRLRMRVGDAGDDFESINESMYRRRYLFDPDVSFRRIRNTQRYRSDDLVKAVHDILTRVSHRDESTECGGKDRLFRPPTSEAAASEFELENPRQAQTCVVVAPCFNNKNVRMCSIRTFKSGPRYNEHPDILDVPFSDQVNLTICQVLRATTASPRVFRRFQVQIGTGIAWFQTFMLGAEAIGWNPVISAMEDYRGPCRRKIWDESPGLMSPQRSDSAPPTSVERPTIGGIPLILSIGWPRMDATRPMPRGRSEKTPPTYVRLSLDLDITEGYENGPAITASGFRAVYQKAIDLVNNNSFLKDRLRETAKELVRRRRARQAMGGPRWEVFVGNAAKTNDGEAKSEVR